MRAILRLAPFNLSAALLILLAGAFGGAAEYAVWSLALALQWLAGRTASTGGFEVAPAHFVERHGLVVLIALGESVVAVGTGALQRPVDVALAGIAVLGLLLTACRWWAYFGGDDGRAEHALDEADGARRPPLALSAFGYWHLPLLLEVIAAASALRQATAHPFAGLDGPRALALSGGVSLFLLGEALFRRTLGIGSGRWRAAVAVLALATLPIGIAVVAAAQLAALVALLVAGFAAEHAATAQRGERKE